jgi:AraC family transcriptional activator of pobA
MKQSIPIHSLGDDSRHGVHLHRIEPAGSTQVSAVGVHRDNHCNFFFQEQGASQFMVDFREMSLHGCGVFCIFPGQVHWPVSIENASGWLLAVDMVFLDATYREVFEEYAADGDPVKLNSVQSAELTACLHILFTLTNRPEGAPFEQQIMNSMVQVCLGLFAAVIEDESKRKNNNHSRPVAIVRAFRHLLRHQFKSVKSPSDYALLLNISSSYLTETVKSITGFPAGYWIHQEIMMEARRLLYFTELDVKQIAFLLGYEDHTYFSRLFRNVIGISPGQFRDGYRK